jgi:hypothetical protein
MRQVMPARRPQLAELGLFLLVVALPLVFTPFSTSPFGDGKLVMLAGGTLALWGSGLAVDRRLGALGAVLATLVVISAFTGVDVMQGLTAQTEGEGGGAILVICCVVLAAVAPSMPDELRERARRWFVAACSVVAVMGLSVRVFPDLGISQFDLEFVGATLGNQLYAAGLLGAGIAAAIGAARSRPLRRVVIVVAVLSLGAATFGERTSIVVPLIAAGATIWRLGAGRRASVMLLAGVIAPLLVWQLAGEALLPDTTGRGEAVGGFTQQATDSQRFVVWGAMGRAAFERPALGWGPGSSQSAYLATARPEDIARATRTWADAHDIVLETAVTSGFPAAVVLLALLLLMAARAIRCRPDRAWAFGAAAALGAFALVEPVGLVLTPLLFLFGGMASRREEAHQPIEAGRAVAALTAGILSVCLVGSLIMITGATFERWGRAYGEAWALERALEVQPWRLSAAERLALRLAIDGRSGDPDAAGQARHVIGDAVARHPWDVDVRLWAADVETLLRDDDAAAAWVEDHLERFPSDAEGIREADREADENT